MFFNKRKKNPYPHFFFNLILNNKKNICINYMKRVVLKVILNETYFTITMNLVISFINLKKKQRSFCHCIKD